MLIQIKMSNGPLYVGKVPLKTMDEVEAYAGNLRFLKIEHSSGPILINVENIISITRAQ